MSRGPAAGVQRSRLPARVLFCNQNANCNPVACGSQNCCRCRCDARLMPSGRRTAAAVFCTSIEAAATSQRQQQLSKRAALGPLPGPG